MTRILLCLRGRLDWTEFKCSWLLDIWASVFVCFFLVLAANWLFGVKNIHCVCASVRPCYQGHTHSSLVLCDENILLKDKNSISTLIPHQSLFKLIMWYLNYDVGTKLRRLQKRCTVDRFKSHTPVARWRLSYYKLLNLTMYWNVLLWSSWLLGINRNLILRWFF